MQTNHSKKPIVVMDSSQISRLIDDQVRIHAGKNVVSARVISDPLDESPYHDRVKLKESVARALHLPEGSYHIYLIHKNDIFIGPVVGICTHGKPSNPLPTGKKARIFKEIIKQASYQGVFVYFFYAKNFSPVRKQIKGYSLDHKGRWISGYYPIPDVIYNRILYRSIEKSPAIKQLLKRIHSDHEIHLFNSRFLNKWEVHDVLASNPLTDKFIPATTVYNRTSLQNFLRVYPEVFLKPRHSSRGQGIIKVVHTAGGGFATARAEWKPSRWIKLNSFSELYKQISNMRVSAKTYIIQQGIDLARYQERVFDLRTQVQKDGFGHWIITGTGVRIAGKNKFVTHIPNGGRAATFDDVITRVFSPGLQKQIREQLTVICNMVPQVLEQGLNLNLAILSMDIGIDRDGRLWVLEVNSKPASFDENDIRQRHTRYLVNYFIFAARENKRKVMV